MILSHIDLASAVEARKAAAHRYVTKAMREVEFLEPVFLGDIVSFYTQTVRIGRTSITVKVSVEAERWGAGRGEKVKVTEAEVVLVAVDAKGHPTPILEAVSDGPYAGHRSPGRLRSVVESHATIARPSAFMERAPPMLYWRTRLLTRRSGRAPRRRRFGGPERPRPRSASPST